MTFAFATRRLPDPTRELRRLDRVLGDVLAAWESAREDGAPVAAWTPPCDVRESGAAVRITLELPGVRPDDVRISLENNVLTIRGEKRQVAEEQAERVHRYERTYGTFERRFTLPATVDADRIEAGFAHGVLTVLLPKVERARPREIRIKVS
ncbi:MAG TPA: Hsp20/alpha crystallin family protein [Gemmatimonadales bacterium]|nr:Hsp20/alpha crystallin family protein [Gemmatimonadales bacterium]